MPQTGSLKQYIYGLVFNTSEIDENGNRVPRTSWAKDVYRGAADLKKVLLAACELGYLKDGEELPPKGTAKFDDIAWSPVGTPVEGSHGVAEKFLDTDLDFTDAMKEAVKFYYKSSHDLPALPDQTLEELNDIFGIKV